MHYIVGLGNPGDTYENTKHNVGFMMLERFVEGAGLPSLHASKTYSGMMSEGAYNGKEVTVLLPHTYMNASGTAVRKLVPKDKIDSLLVVYDDIDIPIGELKVSYGRGDGGHNGIKSIIASLGTKDFARLRVGIASKSMWTGKPVRPKGEALASYVLKRFSSSEIKSLEALSPTVTEAIGLFVVSGKDAVMNRYN
jgi:peptidyl-tRNA hydrolase, PTH1 family